MRGRASISVQTIAAGTPDLQDVAPAAGSGAAQSIGAAGHRPAAIHPTASSVVKIRLFSQQVFGDQQQVCRALRKPPH